MGSTLSKVSIRNRGSTVFFNKKKRGLENLTRPCSTSKSSIDQKVTPDGSERASDWGTDLY